MTLTTSTTNPSATDKAITFCSNTHFHRSLRIPATTSRPTLRVTFATSTNFAAQELPVILFCHPMGCARYLIFRLEHLAVRVGVRIVVVDRPGFGGSTAVSVDQRVQTWLRMVEAVVKELDVQRFAIMAHSAGTVYAVNTAVHLSHLLHPKNPVIALFGLTWQNAITAPWIHPSHSSAPLMRIVNTLPSSWLANLHTIQGLVARYIAPSLSFSAAKLGIEEKLDEDLCQTVYGTDAETWEQVERLQQIWQREEDMSGISAEATLCIQQDGKDWGVYASLPGAIEALQDICSPSHAGSDHSTNDDDTSGRNLSVLAWFAESDVVIGQGGKRYYEDCWRKVDGQGRVRFAAKTVAGTDHDSIVLAEKGCVEEVFREVKNSCG
ncbi:hypothetical protein E4T49_06410 [Aureobasidium sp. EXF-10728]|nr:hypothetical protein E4T49_06410 [Aureobasidium sp. EXF-10728]